MTTTKERGIRELEPGIYQITVSTGRRDPLTGKYQRLWSTVHGGIRAARAERDRLAAEVADDRHLTSTATVGRLLDDWLTHLQAKGRAGKTIQSYRTNIENHLRPALGPIKLRKLSAHDLDQLYARLTNNGMHPRTVGHVHAAIKAALNQGMRWGWVAINVADLAEPPSIPSTDIVVPEPEEVITLIEAAEASRRPEMARFLFVDTTTGLRRSELCALRPDLDVSELGDGTAVLTVRRALTDVDKAGRRAALSSKEPKSARGRRRMAIDPVTLAVIQAQVAYMTDRAEAAGTTLTEGHYLFSDDPNGATPWTPNSVSQYFRRLAHRNNLGHLDLHYLRRFMETRALDAGFAIPQIAARGGHDPAVMLRNYTGAVTASDHRAAAAVAALIAPKT